MNDISYSNGIVKYTSRDYQSILEDFWSVVPAMTELWTPEADADPGVVLSKFLASIADMLGVNLDWLVNELYAPSVSQRKNAEKLFALIGYELGWYKAARTEVTFTNATSQPITLDFGFNGSNFSTLNAYTDITNQTRTITYNILPLTNTYGDLESRAKREITTSNINVFASSDKVTLQSQESVTRVAIEGELRSTSVKVADVKANNYIIKLPSQHVDTTAVWIKASTSSSSSDFINTQWIQCESIADFTVPEPRFAVTYDNYSNAQIQVSNYLNQLENYANNYLIIYWIDCSGVIGCVSENVLQNFLSANDPDSVTDESGDITISNLSNIIELPHTYTVTGQSPETAKEAYFDSRNYINTWDSLITLPDFNRFLNREAGVDCGLVIDCQKALEINQAIYKDNNLTDAQKSKQYINNQDFPKGYPTEQLANALDINLSTMSVKHYVLSNESLDSICAQYNVTPGAVLNANGLNDGDEVKSGMTLIIPGGFSEQKARGFVSNFQTYTAMCFAIHNDFNDSSWGLGQISPARFEATSVFKRYKPPMRLVDEIIKDYRPLQAMSVELQFGYVRVFDFYVVGQIYPKKPVTYDNAVNIIRTVKEALALYFSPANRKIGQKPTVMEIVKVIQNAHSDIDYFDAGSIKRDVIVWKDCDIEYFNPISFARLVDPGETATNIRIAPDYMIS